MWITIDTGGRYLPNKFMLTQHSVECIHLEDSVLAILDTPRNRQICTLLLLQYPCSVQQGVDLSEILLAIRTANPKRITKMS